MINRFNLVDEPWIPVVNVGKVSLRRVFSDPTLTSLGGNSIQKISVLKLLLAIAQTAYTPADDADWKRLGAEELGKYCVDYLSEKRDLFWLYGEKPFLQMPVLQELKDKNGNSLTVSEIGRTYIPDLPSENDSVLFQNQINKPLTDDEKALYIITLMNYSLGGKRTVKNVLPLTNAYTGKTNSAKAAPSLGGYVGYQNSCLWGMCVLETVWLNLLTRAQLSGFIQWKEEDLIPPWEEMPKGEDDDIAQRLKNGFMGTLCSLSRFVLLKDDGIIYMEGIQFPSHKDGWREPMISSNSDGKMLWLDTAKKPWRNLTALLQSSFQNASAGYDCPQIRLCLRRTRTTDIKEIGIWSGGLKVRGTAGDQSVKQTDDYIESSVFIECSQLKEPWFLSLQSEMDKLNSLAKQLRQSIISYYTSLGKKKMYGSGQNNSVSDEQAKKALSTFWMLCETRFQELVNLCDDMDEQNDLVKAFASFVFQVYDDSCPRDSARQLGAWAKNRPRIGWYIVRNKKEEETIG